MPAAIAAPRESPDAPSRGDHRQRHQRVQQRVHDSIGKGVGAERAPLRQQEELVYRRPVSHHVVALECHLADRFTERQRERFVVLEVEQIVGDEGAAETRLMQQQREYDEEARDRDDPCFGTRLDAGGASAQTRSPRCTIPLARSDRTRSTSARCSRSKPRRQIPCRSRLVRCATPPAPCRASRSKGSTRRSWSAAIAAPVVSTRCPTKRRCATSIRRTTTAISAPSSSRRSSCWCAGWAIATRRSWRAACRAGGRVLDVGCGRGVILGALADRGLEAHGFEISEAATRGVDPRAKVCVAPRLEAAGLSRRVLRLRDHLACARARARSAQHARDDPAHRCVPAGA